MTLILLLALATLGIVLLYLGRPYWAWVAPGTIGLAWWTREVGLQSVGTAHTAALGIFVVLAIAFGIPAVRTVVASQFVMRVMRMVLPRIGETERIALEAGTVWLDGDLFSGAPDWHRLLDFEIRTLSEKERAFLAGPVDELCAMLDEWTVTQMRDLPPDVWAHLKHHGFFGMIIPEEHGGLGFSAAGHSAVIMKIASRSITAAVTVMVPNSLGPAELLLHYGTEEQRAHYLPRLARGEEIPCFALTGPEAGSDAAATQSVGVVCRGQYQGEEVLGLRLSWRKRYITLGPIATVIGLAFRLRDPDHLIGDQEDRGITCALVPADVPGINIGARHDPMGVPFQNGPNWGTDVFVPIEFIIGGQAMAGQGWRMLMDSLAAGRSISLPALATSSAQLATRVTGAYATVREQFDTPIGRFEGIEEPLARIGGLTYMMDAARRLTAGAVDAGEKPAVLSAIAKAYLTESMRQVINDAMDIRAGAAICRGPRNILAHAYQAVPVGITVEGANILTRSMIIYGQGAIRCHPYVQREMEAVAASDVKAFDRAFFGHVGHVASTVVRTLLLGLTNARLAPAPGGGLAGRYLQHFSHASAAFAVVSDVAMATLGGTLKRREKISGRLADALAWTYLGASAVKRFADDDRPESDEPFLRYACDLALFRVQSALAGVLDNLPNRLVGVLLKPIVFPLGQRRRAPNDRLGAEVARGLLENREARLALTRDIYIPPPEEPGLGRLEAALDRAVDALAIEAKIRDAVRSGQLDRVPGDELLENALAAGIITAEDRQTVLAADELRAEVIKVDAFDPQTFESVEPYI